MGRRVLTGLPSDPPSDWSDLSEWWLQEVRDPAYREEVESLFLEVMEISPGEVVIDLGCGDGRTLDLVAGLGMRAIGIDVNPDLAARAAGRHPVVIGRLPDLGFVKDGSIGVAYAVLSLEHVENLEKLFIEVQRTVRPGGTLAVVINHPIYTSPGSGPVIDPTDGEMFWRFGQYLHRGSGFEPAGDQVVEFRHRPLGVLLTAAARAGWSLEVALEQGVGTSAASRDPILAKHQDIPHLMALRWRR